MYPWRKDEEITAAKLNTMQIRPFMETINKLGIGIGGLDDSALSSDVINSDGGSWSTVIPEPVIITEHEVGNLKYEYDAGSEGWKLRTGRAGTTGKPQVAAGELKWLCKNDLPNDAKKYVWQKINTDSYGNPVTIATCINTNPSMQTNTWDPATGTTGTIWRRLASIEPNTDITCEVSCKKSWAMKAINENNAFMLPIARRYGSLQGWENIYLNESSDVKDRGSSSHWAPVMYGEGGMSNLIQSIGELGGTFVYQTKEGCGSDNDYGIGIASGIEFYDDISIRECYNCHEMRPKPTRACAPLGPDGKYGKIIIQSVNPKHPWQFQLTADFDIGSCGGWDPGSLPLAYGQVQYSFPDESYLCWPSTPGYSCKRTGVVTGEFRRVCGGIVCEGELGNIHNNYQYAVGEIKDGKIGIRTATWRDPMSNEPSKSTIFGWNRHGGVVMGIEEDIPFDSTVKPYIDRNGLIHVKNINMSCAGASGKIVTTKNVAQAISQGMQGQNRFSWGTEQSSASGNFKISLCPADTYAHVNNQSLGVFSGIISNVDTQYVSDRHIDISAGETKCGVLGLSAASFYALDDGARGTENDPYDFYWTPGGGLIRGILADLSPELGACGRPIAVPYIDQAGMIHIYAPQMACSNANCRLHYKGFYDLCGREVEWEDLD